MKSRIFLMIFFLMLSLQIQASSAKLDTPSDVRKVTGTASNLTSDQIEDYVNRDLEYGQYYYLRSMLRGFQNSSNAQDAYKILTQKPLEIRQKIVELILRDEDCWFLPSHPKNGDIGLNFLRESFQPNFIKTVDPNVAPEDLATPESRADYLKRLEETGVIPPRSLASNLPAYPNNSKPTTKPAAISGTAQTPTTPLNQTWQLPLTAIGCLLAGFGGGFLFHKRRIIREVGDDGRLI